MFGVVEQDGHARKLTGRRSESAQKRAQFAGWPTSSPRAFGNIEPLLASTPLADDLKYFNRCELKYILHCDQARAFGEELSAHMSSDDHSDGVDGYPVYSIYYDSPKLACFWEKIEGIKYRRKVRFRRYGASPDVFLEIKQRVDRTVEKRRSKWPLQRVVESFADDTFSDPEDFSQQDRVISEIGYLWQHYGLQRTMGVSYRRRAFFAVRNPSLRVTFDSLVKYHPIDLDIAALPQDGKNIIEPEQVVMEIKYSDCVPLWLCKLVGRFGLPMMRMSKYCTAVDKEHFGGRLT